MLLLPGLYAAASLALWACPADGVNLAAALAAAAAAAYHAGRAPPGVRDAATLGGCGVALALTAPMTGGAGSSPGFVVFVLGLVRMAASLVAGGAEVSLAMGRAMRNVALSVGTAVGLAVTGQACALWVPGDPAAGRSDVWFAAQMALAGVACAAAAGLRSSRRLQSRPADPSPAQFFAVQAAAHAVMAFVAGELVRVPPWAVLPVAAVLGPLLALAGGRGRAPRAALDGATVATAVRYAWVAVHTVDPAVSVCDHVALAAVVIAVAGVALAR